MKKVKHLIPLVCETCGKVYEGWQSEANRRFCSDGCYDRTRANFKSTNHNFVCKECGQEYYRKHPHKCANQYCSKKCFIAHRKTNAKSDINHLIRNSSAYKNWKKQVFERDKYTCRVCGDNSGGNLNAHHIIPYSVDESLRIDVGNGVTLCTKCHTKAHQKMNNDKQMNIFNITINIDRLRK